MQVSTPDWERCGACSRVKWRLQDQTRSSTTTKLPVLRATSQPSCAITSLPGFLFPYLPPRPLSAASTVTSRLDHRRRPSTTTKLPVLRAISRPSCPKTWNVSLRRPVITIHAHEKNQSEVRDDLSISPSFCLPRSVSLCAARQRGEVETGSEAEVVNHDEAAATPCNLSAELRYEAPLATFDGDEWTEFLLDAPPDNNHFRSPVDDVTSGGERLDQVTPRRAARQPLPVSR